MTREPDRAPPRAVLAAFGRSGAAARPLPGGEESSMVAGGIVFKNVQDVLVARWAQGALATIEPLEFRIPQPVRSDGGDWVVDGWTATEYVPDLGSLRGDPARVTEVGMALSRALGGPSAAAVAAVGQRRDRWSIADRCAWDEVDIPDSLDRSELAAVIAPLRARVADRAADHVAVVHGDLSGNVFVDAEGTPVVLDFTPYVRPRRYASAIVVADHLLWYGGTAHLVDLIDGDQDLLARAILFRLLAEQFADEPRHGADLADYRRTIDALGWT